MCRINTDPKFDLIKKERTRILNENSVTVTIEDDIEGDVTFNVRIKQDKTGNSQTYIHFKDEHHAIVEIINPNPASNVMPSEPMEIGTYRNDYRLFMDYKLYKKYDGEDFRDIGIEFGTIKMAEDGRKKLISDMKTLIHLYVSSLSQY